MLRKRIVLDALIALACATFFASSAFAYEKVIPLPCNQVKNLAFSSWGLKKPTDWKCTAYVSARTHESHLVMWEKEEKAIGISISEAETWQTDEKQWKKQVPSYGLQNPFASVRNYLEFFFAEPDKLKNNPYLKANADYSLGLPKAVLFSKNNQNMIVYQNNGDHLFKGKKVIWQNAYVFRKDDKKHYLAVDGYACSPDDFFSLIINPLIQR
jgi:hypothetical protein